MKDTRYLAFTHYDFYHLNGIAGALNVFKVVNVMAPDYTANTKVFESFQEITVEKGLEIISIISTVKIINCLEEISMKL